MDNNSNNNYYVNALPCKKRYPTYQFHGVTINDKLPAEEVMGICVLEVMKWLRKRIAGDRDPAEVDFPAEIDLPEPENFESFDRSKLRTFTLNLGFSVEALYSEQNKLWAFCLTETDTGLKDKRAPVVGRSYETNISFRAVGGCVEVGVQTVCSEPESSQEPCEVLRPAVVKEMYNNPNIGLRHILNVTHEPIAIESAKDFARVKEAAESEENELPIVFVTTPEAKKPAAPEPAADMPSAKPSAFSSSLFSSSSGGLAGGLSGGFSAPKLDMSGIKLDTKIIKAPEKKSEAPKTAPKPLSAPAQKAEKAEIPPTVDIAKIADRCASFAFICAVPQRMFEQVRTTFCGELSRGDILILYKNKQTELIPFDDISDDIKKAQYDLISGIKDYPKRRSINWGDTLFLTDAKIMELKQRHGEKISHEDEVSDLRAEIEALSLKLKDAKEAANDSAASSNTIREQNKRITALERELEYAKKDAEARQKLFEEYKAFHDSLGARISFYKDKIVRAAKFPLCKEDIPQYIRDEFSGTIYLHDKAAEALEDYKKIIDYEAIFDGLYYLHGYGLYCQKKISDDEFKFFAEGYGWKPLPCGDGARNMFPAEYSVTVNKDGKTINVKLKKHIKYGRDSERWTRIYFFYNDDLERVVIGYMPDHLHTSADRT